MTHVTAQNIEEVRDSITAIDQRAELVVGCETWPIFYEGGQRGDITIWPNGRGAVCFGADSAWGEWDETRRTLELDEGDHAIISEDGKIMGQRSVPENWMDPKAWNGAA